jgi:hypothetical protein
LEYAEGGSSDSWEHWEDVGEDMGLEVEDDVPSEYRPHNGLDKKGGIPDLGQGLEDAPHKMNGKPSKSGLILSTSRLSPGRARAEGRQHSFPVRGHHVSGGPRTPGRKKDRDTHRLGVDIVEELPPEEEEKEWFRKTMTCNGRDIEVYVNGKGYECEVCRRVFDRRSYEMAHEPCYSTKTGIVDNGNQINAYRCEYCLKMYRNLNQLKSHYASHVDDSLFRCMACGYECCREADIGKHIIRVHYG